MRRVKITGNTPVKLMFRTAGHGLYCPFFCCAVGKLFVGKVSDCRANEDHLMGKWQVVRRFSA